MTNTTPPPPTTPAGWYSDNEGRMRWWDGRQWTDTYAPVVVAQPQRAAVSTFSVLGFILALVGFLSAFGGVLGLGLGVLGLVASIGGYRDKVRRGRGLAVAGIVVSSAALLIGGVAAVRILTGTA